jgi:hypothetical protein
MRMAMECGRRWRGQRRPRQTIMLDKDKCRRTEEGNMETEQGQRTGPPPYDLPAALFGVATDHVSRLTSHFSRRPVSLRQAMTCTRDRVHHHTLTPDHEP